MSLSFERLSPSLERGRASPSPSSSHWREREREREGDTRAALAVRRRQRVALSLSLSLPRESDQEPLSMSLFLSLERGASEGRVGGAALEPARRRLRLSVERERVCVCARGAARARRYSQVDAPLDRPSKEGGVTPRSLCILVYIPLREGESLSLSLTQTARETSGKGSLSHPLSTGRDRGASEVPRRSEQNYLLRAISPP